MPLAEDLVRITDIVTYRDPSFAHVPKPKIDAHIHNLEKHANAEETEHFLLSAMRLMALPGNGHTRLIPIDAIKAYPLRFVTTGARILLTNAPRDQSDALFHELVAINDQPIHALTQRADTYLAGTSQRKRVIGPLLYTWPAALAELGAPSINGSHTFRFVGPDDETTVIELSEPDVRPASEFYPRNEHGQPEPLWEVRDFARVVSYPETGMVIALPSFFRSFGDRALHGHRKRCATGKVASRKLANFDGRSRKHGRRLPHDHATHRCNLPKRSPLHGTRR